MKAMRSAVRCAGARRPEVCRRSCNAVRPYSEVASATTPSSNLAKIIRDTIRATGPLSIARYMQLCLSHPTEGYYARGDVFGAKGDFITSPEISQIFGELVGIWLLTRWMAAGKPGRCRVVELGPGRGTLMDDILRTFATFPGIKDSLTSVHLVENSARMRDIQRSRLEPKVGTANLHWSGSIDDVPESDEYTMLVAHEFFDAMPIHLFERVQDGFREVRVDLDPSHDPRWVVDIITIKSPLGRQSYSQLTPRLPALSKSSGLRLAVAREPTPSSSLLPASSPRWASLAPGTRVEVSGDSWKIMRRAGQLLTGAGRGDSAAAGGAGLVVDYGGDRTFSSSFRAFRNHKIVDIFEQPGSSDLTANVDFAYLRESLAGVATALGPIPQSQFLLSLGLQPRLAQLAASAKTPDRRADLEKGAKRLIDTLGMGSQYQVMGVVGGANVAEDVYPFPSSAKSGMAAPAAETAA